MDTEVKNRKIVLLISIVGAFVTPFMGSAVVIALPTIANDFGMSTVMQSWVLNTYLLASAIFLIPFGRIADIYGRKRIYLYGVRRHFAFGMNNTLFSA